MKRRCHRCQAIISDTSASGLCHICIRCPVADPTPEEIARECQAIREGWTPQEWQRRLGHSQDTSARIREVHVETDQE